jgi:hypothetical protein
VVVNCNFHSFGCTIDVIWRFGLAVSEVFSLNKIVVFVLPVLGMKYFCLLLTALLSDICVV